MFNQFEDRGQLANVLQRRLNMTGAAPAPSVAPELFPCLVYENDRIEWGYLKNEIPYSRHRVTNTPAAGQHAAVVLENPAISGVIVVVKRVLSSLNARVSNVSTPNGTLVFGDAGFSRDSRTSVRSRAFVSEYAVLTANMPSLQWLAIPNVETDLEWVVAPGQFLILASNTAAASLTGGFAWTERPAVQGELG